MKIPTSQKSKTAAKAKNRPTKPFFLGICGPSGSGKTTFADQLTKNLDSKHYAVLEQDNYYKDLSHLPASKRALHNFDHPHSLDLETYLQNIKDLASGKVIKMPQYDFSTHSRTSKTVKVEPRPLIICLGILLLADERVCEQLDLKIYLDTDVDLCLERRVRRDIRERGRTVESVLGQYRATVKPMFDAFVAPSKKKADILVPFNSSNLQAENLVRSFIEGVVQSSS